MVLSIVSIGVVLWELCFFYNVKASSLTAQTNFCTACFQALHNFVMINLSSFYFFLIIHIPQLKSSLSFSSVKFKIQSKTNKHDICSFLIIKLLTSDDCIPLKQTGIQEATGFTSESPVKWVGYDNHSSVIETRSSKF